MNAFDDVNGWDLQHARRVPWCRLPEDHAFGSVVFGANPTRYSGVWNEEVLDFAAWFLNSPRSHWQTASLPDLPPEEPGRGSRDAPGGDDARPRSCRHAPPGGWARERAAGVPEGRDGARLWVLRLANALSALYPTESEEKRLLDAMILAVPR